MKTKYEILVNILDKLRFDAPNKYSSYHDDSCEESTNHGRSKAFIHLFLMVKFGLTDFEKRQIYITDGARDGGLDAFYIDDEKKKIYLIQSKFRTNPKNFEEKSISSDELVKMELREIIKGHKKDSNGTEFNNKIKEFQRNLNIIRNIAAYDYEVVILGNLTKYNDPQIKKLIGNFKYEIYNFKKTYNLLTFPMCSGTLFEPKEINIKINLYKKTQVNVDQEIESSYGPCSVMLLFVPTREIGCVLSKYKNAILRYNPRNYLSLSKNKVNLNISNSIVKGTKNDFSLLNNGITIITDGFKISTERGSEIEGQLLLYNPQIINGGQTAYTLCQIYENQNINDSVFQGKEVLLKIVRLENAASNHLNFLKNISDSTNSQTKVEEADKRSNDQIQIEIQEKIYNDFGYFYERKSGEFFNARENRYLPNDLIIDRSRFLRCYFAFQGNAKDARNKGDDSLFKLDTFEKIVHNSNNYIEMFYAYKVYQTTQNLRKKYIDKNLLTAFRYGKYAIIASIGLKTGRKKISIEDLKEENIEKICNLVLRKWKKFEREVSKKRSNKMYKIDKVFDFDNYYKGTTVDKDLIEFFGNK